MKVDYKKVDEFINSITKQNNIKSILLYGEDVSSVNKKYKIILNEFVKVGYEISDIPLENLKNNDTLLSEKFFSIPMFATNTLYIFRLLEKENSYTKFIQNLFENNNVCVSDNFLVITAGGLDTTSSLRKYAEKSQFIASIGCYEDSDKNIEIFINNKLKTANFVFNNEVVSYIANNVGNNNLVIENEINKLILYKNNDKKLTLDDVKKCITDISKTSIDDFCNNFCLLNKEETFRNLKKMFAENVELIVIIRSLVRCFLQLQRIYFLIENGNSIDNVFKTEKIFWKQQINIKSYLNKWNLQKVNNFLELLLNIEKTSKFSLNKNIEFENFILKSILFFSK